MRDRAVCYCKQQQSIRAIKSTYIYIFALRSLHLPRCYFATIRATQTPKKSRDQLIVCSDSFWRLGGPFREPHTHTHNKTFIRFAAVMSISKHRSTVRTHMNRNDLVHNRLRAFCTAVRVYVYVVTAIRKSMKIGCCCMLCWVVLMLTCAQCISHHLAKGLTAPCAIALCSL